MGKDLKIAIIGLVHDHVWNYLDSLNKLRNAKVTCVADANPELLEKINQALHLPKERLYTDYQQLLGKEEVDACLIFTETCRHSEITEKCAERGIHVMVEKPMAINAEDAARMVRAAKKNKIKLMINFIMGFRPFVKGLYDLVKKEEIGQIKSIRFVGGHIGPREVNCSEYFYNWLFSREKNGGGALVDFGCYGAVFLAWLMGKPDRVVAVKGNLKNPDIGVEDNAVIVLKYDEKKAMGTIEGTWVQALGGSYLQIFGDKGAVLNNPIAPLEFYQRTTETSWKRTKFKNLPEGFDQPIPYFINCIHNDLPINGVFNAECALIAQEILEAARTSAETGVEIKLS